MSALRDSLSAADLEYRTAYREIKNASPLWREMLTRGGSPITPQLIQEALLGADEVLALYDVGVERSFLFLVPPEGDLLAFELTVPDSLSEVLGLEPGPLTDIALTSMIHPDTASAATTVLPTSPSTRSIEIGVQRWTTTDRLRALHSVLLPEEVWAAVESAERIVVVPDGALHQLPFETLVVDQTESDDGDVEPVYWVDQGPLVRYSASATVLANLERRDVGREASGLLSLSDPIYDPREVAASAAEPGRSSGVARDEYLRAAFARGGGVLSRLPGTARESEAIAESFAQAGEPLTLLQGDEAGEPELRAALGGQRYLHLATHGLVDQNRSSMFASLALTPPSSGSTDPADDGFLQLHEIYGLDLDGTELAVLSACETAVGDNVAGEGVFALSRGFLVAGARRVVASHWPVSDDSTARLVGELFAEIARARAAGEPVDYAAAMRSAQLSVRNDPEHPEWTHPYYWAPFVLTGAR